MYYLLLKATVTIVGYSMFLYSLWSLLSPYLGDYFKNGIRAYKRRRQIKRLKELNNVVRKERKQGRVIEHLDLLLSSLNHKSNVVSVGNFMILTTIILITTFITLYLMVDDPIFSVIIATSMGVLPYSYFRFKLTSQRLNTSFSFMQEFHVFLQNYQSTGNDLYYTLMNVTKEIQNKSLRSFFMRLLSSVQKDRNEAEFKKAINVFIYSINSTTAKRFGKLIEMAHLENMDISTSLMDLQEDIKKRKQDIDKDKTNKVETVILGYSGLVVLPGFLYLGYRIAGVIDFWYIFTQKLPFTIFIVSCVLTVFSAFSAYLFNKPRADV